MKFINYFDNQLNKKEVKKLYYSAFPENERVPYMILLRNGKKKRGEFFKIYDHEKFIGLVYSIVYQDIVYLYYFAIKEELRNQGYGTKILNQYKDLYSNKKIILMAETISKDAPNYQERVNRGKFYSKNGFIYQGYTIRELDVTYDMLGYNKEDIKVTKEEFKELIRYYFGEFSYNRIYKRISDIEE